MNRARFILLTIFLVSLLVQVLSFLMIRDRMWPEDLLTLLTKLLAIYSVHLGLIFGAMFARVGTSLRAPQSPIVWTAILVSTVWNLLLIWRSVSFAFAGQDSVGDLIKYLDGISSASSFLVTGALAFFFAKSARASGAGAGRQGS